MHRWIPSSLLVVALGVSAVFAAPGFALKDQGKGSKPAPELVGRQWINSDKPLTLAALRGKVVLLHFWTFGCINCRHNLPVYARLQKEFSGRDVQMIGIHSPEQDFEKPLKNVQAAVQKLHITFPVLLDPVGENWNAYGQQYWPAVYVIDKKGIIRGMWEGELNYNGADGERRVGALVNKLLADG